MADFGGNGHITSGRRKPAGTVRAGLAALAAILFGIAPAFADAPTVVVSIKPVHSLVASVMAGVGAPVLLVDGKASPHSWTLKPSQAAALSEAGLVVWIGEGMESYLASPIGSLVPEERVLELADLPTILLLPLREGGVWEPHADDDPDHTDEEHADEALDDTEHDHADEHGGYDPHLWLNPLNAIAIARAVAGRLAALDPDNASTYEANLAALTANIETLDAMTAAALDPVRGRPFIVFHDAYQYFERHYGLTGVGSITLDPEQSPSAARLAAIRGRLAAADVVCAFAEPVMDRGLLETAVEGSAVRIATLDPEGVALEPGPALYVRLIGDLTRSMASCLGG